jgi:signal transduction histidine kinase
LGPTLAGLTLRIDAARNKLVSDPRQADRLLIDTKERIQGTIEDIRRLVYELRPPALDELGLEKAIRAYVVQHYPDSPRIHVEGIEGLPPLPAAVEVAAYRIALEGITNVIRHAHASEAAVHIDIDRDSLVVEIMDDGIGFPDPIPIGVGLTSMRERAEELGGNLDLIPQEIGSLIHACLPLPKE